MAAPSMVIERERKYEIVPGSGVPRLLGVAGVATQDDPVEQVLDASYYDTRTFRLAQAGITLRRRVGGHDAGWHVKLPVSADERREIQLPLGGDAHQVPGRLKRLVRAYTLGEKLVPIAHLRTDRFAHRLADAEGRTVAVLTDDHVTGEAGGESARLDEWRELELELDPGTEPGLLAEFDRALAGAGATASPWPSKLRRLIGDRVPAPRRARKKPAAADVVLASLRAHFDDLRRADVGVRLDVADSVHQMRVASRKLRSALRTFGSIVDEEATAPVAAELKWLGHELAPARDTEVTQDRLGEQLDGLPPELVLGPLRQYLTRYFAREEEQGRTRALEALTGKRYRNLLRALDAVLAEPALTDGGRKPAKSALRKSVRKAAKKLRRAQAATRGLKGADLETALHDVRKKAKRARYAADTVKPVYGKKLRAWRKNVKAVQQTLGAHQDTVVGREVLHHLAVDGHGEGQNTFTFGILHGQDAAKAARLREEFAGQWRRLRKGDRPGWLG
ncbi:CYTH and CHAD domain-containing protein [Amycolatopsis sp. WQ 127309]|uniref:CYTH and CHAD domain-containing protein n=1 Tax=Amycolatopsis sp. WQ 127309 TaxID=2932773 RepID=UPI001FF6195F|nr:CYTH and CHAD domain-containing protein [Amycolatopsis sp. WQ 127309]UOZ04758.1 CYTH and CHAD domain-containing protein [Amycolatopsis sp. WQ 127309]